MTSPLTPCPQKIEGARHTPGPWEYVPKLTASENHRGFFVRAEKVTRNGKWALAEVQPGDENGKLGEANARLIASSPELLEVARDEYLSMLEHAAQQEAEEEQPPHTFYRDRLQKLRALLAKATASPL